MVLCLMRVSCGSHMIFLFLFSLFSLETSRAAWMVASMNMLLCLMRVSYGSHMHFCVFFLCFLFFIFDVFCLIFAYFFLSYSFFFSFLFGRRPRLTCCFASCPFPTGLIRYQFSKVSTLVYLLYHAYKFSKVKAKVKARVWPHTQ